MNLQKYNTFFKKLIEIILIMWYNYKCYKSVCIDKENAKSGVKKYEKDFMLCR